MFISHFLQRTIRIEEDLVDQLFNSSEKRLAGAFLLLANFGKDGEKDHREGQPGDACGHDRHHALAREVVLEQVPEIGLHRLQWSSEGNKPRAG